MEEKLSATACQQRLSAVGDAMYVIGGKWKLRIIIALRDDHKRFNDLQRTVAGISAKVLSSELKDLEMNGFVKRNIIEATPVVVEYVLTDYSESLNDVLRTLSNFGEMHREKLRSER